MKKRLSLVTLLAAVLIICFPSITKACVCVDTMEGNPACQAFWDHTVIFSGRVVAILPPGRDRENPRATYESSVVRIAVEKSYKGVEAQSVDLSLEPGTDCTYPFEMGKEYFVYGIRNPANNKIFQDSCSRTLPLSQAGTDVNYAQQIAAGAEPKLSLYGSVLQPVKFETYGQNYIGVKGIKIIVKNDSKTIEIRTDSNGSYQLFGLKDGLYNVSAEFPKALKPTRADLPKQVRIASSRCAGAVFVTKSSGS